MGGFDQLWEIECVIYIFNTRVQTQCVVACERMAAHNYGLNLTSLVVFAITNMEWEYDACILWDPIVPTI
ncbi:hypothetical protein CDL12_26242 [Handroanthus impetiginosus]|uniref:Uncharacterized protein n=1 Tax=Handroanthus impetiginosus TaxID=429701 RepID=A0A2G9G7I1_9LAMI|nr:hypothetical protein CDL12_26242 [Handroanthus impetiginosus]